ncbi:MAG: tryptophan--tRNA ligase [Alphaproteobacteria bacterium]|nr:tryptophan--tRNA ligase [Alphaproteobacteria bacterium]
MANNKIFLSGIKPTGTVHLGNYIGMLSQMRDISREHKTIMFIADLHALNIIRDAAAVREHTYEIAAIIMSIGFNMDNVLMFRQSDVPAVCELSTMLTNVTPKGLMDRAHSYKAATDRNTAAGNDADFGVNMGLYTYPILMAADILLYGADIVPVGADQKQHVEFARDIAGHFNTIYGNLFKLPEAQIMPDAGIIPGLDGRKMSKSYDNVIPLMASSAELKKRIMRIITDSKTPDEPKNPDESTIFMLYRHFATPEESADFAEKFRAGGMGYGDAKKILFEKLDSVLAPMRERYEYLMAHRTELDAALANGADVARKIANKTMPNVRHVMLGTKK